MSSETSSADHSMRHIPENPELDEEYSIWNRAMNMIRERIDFVDKCQLQAFKYTRPHQIPRLKEFLKAMLDEFPRTKDSDIIEATYVDPDAPPAALTDQNPFYIYKLKEVTADLGYTVKALGHINESLMSMSAFLRRGVAQDDSNGAGVEEEQTSNCTDPKVLLYIQNYQRKSVIAMVQHFCMLSEVLRAWSRTCADGNDRFTDFGNDIVRELAKDELEYPKGMESLRNCLSHEFAYSMCPEYYVEDVFTYCRQIFPTWQQQLLKALNQIVEAYPYLIRKQIAKECKPLIEDRFKPKVKTPWEILAEIPDEELFVPVVPVLPNDGDEQVHEEAPEAEQSSANEPFSVAKARQRLDDIYYYALEILNRHNDTDANGELPWDDICDLQRICALCKVTEPDRRASL